MTWRPCAHKTWKDFAVVLDPDDGRLVWRCSHCKTEGKWTKTWRYFGTYECKKCWTADMVFVGCSDRCWEALKKRLTAKDRVAAEKALRP
jgi:hypothetical protein